MAVRIWSYWPESYSFKKMWPKWGWVIFVIYLQCIIITYNNHCKSNIFIRHATYVVYSGYTGQDDVIKWKHFPHHQLFVKGSSPVIDELHYWPFVWWIRLIDGFTTQMASNEGMTYMCFPHHVRSYLFSPKRQWSPPHGVHSTLITLWKSYEA